MDCRTMDVIIPVCRPGKKFDMLMERLQNQTRKPGHIILINTEKVWWDAADIAHERYENGQNTEEIPVFLHHISAEEFDHGGTRNQAAGMSDADILVFMTQDAVPADEYLLENLTAHLAGETAAAYARQLPEENCRFLERYTRGFNYGPSSRMKTGEDLEILGIKTYFCSNVCAAYQKQIYEKMGGFEKKTIFNEDMIFAAGLIRAGYAVAYEAEARVVHSHNYSGLQQFRRNFDLAVSQAEHPEIFAEVPSESEGIRLVKSTAGYLLRSGKAYLLPQLIWQSGWKYMGYLLGRHYRSLPAAFVRFCSMNKKYWENKVF